jgi:general secretion pathway protein N
MIRRPHILALALLSGGALCFGVSPNLMAATSSTPDILSNDRAGDADVVDIGSVKPIARPNNRDTVKPAPSGNPLWSVPLSVLSATQERPIFSASRRPPQRAVVAPSVDQVAAPPPPVAGPERPALALIGAVVGDSDAIAVFLDQANQKIVRLRQGDTHAGWVLSSVQGREVTLKKADQIETLGIQRQETAAPAAGAGVPMPASAAATPASGSFDTSYAPFVPRSTPKNGESDGL